MEIHTFAQASASTFRDHFLSKMFTHMSGRCKHLAQSPTEGTRWHVIEPNLKLVSELCPSLYLHTPISWPDLFDHAGFLLLIVCTSSQLTAHRTSLSPPQEGGGVPSSVAGVRREVAQGDRKRDQEPRSKRRCSIQGWLASWRWWHGSDGMERGVPACREIEGSWEYSQPLWQWKDRHRTVDLRTFTQVLWKSFHSRLCSQCLLHRSLLWLLYWKQSLTPP